MKEYWIWLSTLPYVGAVTQKRLLEAFMDPVRIYHATESELQTVQGISKRAIESLRHHRSLDASKQILDDANKKKISLLTYNHSKYPACIKAIREAPPLLYYIGELRSFEEAVAVVGARRCTAYGKNVAKALASELAKNKIPVLSGLAKGIDGYAHTACLNENGYTIAFVASGVDVCYPKEHRSLYEQIKATGAIISKYPPRIPPKPKYFLDRNGLMSAFATKVVIVEAGERSGSLSTAEFAKKQGKKLFAVPHPIDSASGIGTNKLLADGALPYINFSSLGLGLNNLPEESTLNKRLIKEDKRAQPIENSEQKLFELLTAKPRSVLFLARELDIPAVKLRDQLFNLELEGKIFVRADTVSLKR